MDFEVLEGLKSSGKLVGGTTTNPDTYMSSWCRIMTRSPWGIVCPVYGMLKHHFRVSKARFRFQKSESRHKEPICRMRFKVKSNQERHLSEVSFQLVFLCSLY